MASPCARSAMPLLLAACCMLLVAAAVGAALPTWTSSAAGVRAEQSRMSLGHAWENTLPLATRVRSRRRVGACYCRSESSIRACSTACWRRAHRLLASGTASETSTYVAGRGHVTAALVSIHLATKLIRAVSQLPAASSGAHRRRAQSATNKAHLPRRKLQQYTLPYDQVLPGLSVQVRCGPNLHSSDATNVCHCADSRPCLAIRRCVSCVPAMSARGVLNTAAGSCPAWSQTRCEIGGSIAGIPSLARRLQQQLCDVQGPLKSVEVQACKNAQACAHRRCSARTTARTRCPSRRARDRAQSPPRQT